MTAPLHPEVHVYLGTSYPFPECLFSTPHKVSTKKFSYEALTFWAHACSQVYSILSPPKKIFV